MKVTAVITKSKDDYYGIYVEENLPGFGLYGWGFSEEEAKEDMLIAYGEWKEICLEENKPAPPELEFEYKYDLESFPEMAVQGEGAALPNAKTPYRTASTAILP